jgi:hypothetical protein
MGAAVNGYLGGVASALAHPFKIQYDYFANAKDY